LSLAGVLLCRLCGGGGRPLCPAFLGARCSISLGLRLGLLLNGSRLSLNGGCLRLHFSGGGGGGLVRGLRHSGSLRLYNPGLRLRLEGGSGSGFLVCRHLGGPLDLRGSVLNFGLGSGSGGDLLFGQRQSGFLGLDGNRQHLCVSGGGISNDPLGHIGCPGALCLRLGRRRSCLDLLPTSIPLRSHGLQLGLRLRRPLRPGLVSACGFRSLRHVSGGLGGGKSLNLDFDGASSRYFFRSSNGIFGRPRGNGGCRLLCPGLVRSNGLDRLGLGGARSLLRLASLDRLDRLGACSLGFDSGGSLLCLRLLGLGCRLRRIDLHLRVGGGGIGNHSIRRSLRPGGVLLQLGLCGSGRPLRFSLSNSGSLLRLDFVGWARGLHRFCRNGLCLCCGGGGSGGVLSSRSLS